MKASFYIPENRLNFPTTKGFRMNIFMKLVYQYMTTFFYSFTHIKSSSSAEDDLDDPLQVENCDSNSRLVVDEDDNVKSGLKGLTVLITVTGNEMSVPT